MNMKGKYVAVFIILIAAAALIYFYFSNKSENQQLSNPAAVKCAENGGTLFPVEFEEGTDSFCKFDDGSVCWEWDFYRGDCARGELKIETLEEGSGNPAGRGDTVKVHYTGKLENGTVFDSSLSGDPYSFTLGSKGVIDGWEFGVLGMKVGKKRMLTIAPELGYGSMDYGPIPANSKLIFEVELMEII